MRFGRERRVRVREVAVPRVAPVSKVDAVVVLIVCLDGALVVLVVAVSTDRDRGQLIDLRLFLVAERSPFLALCGLLPRGCVLERFRCAILVVVKCACFVTG